MASGKDGGIKTGDWNEWVFRKCKLVTTQSIVTREQGKDGGERHRNRTSGIHASDLAPFPVLPDLRFLSATGSTTHPGRRPFRASARLRFSRSAAVPPGFPLSLFGSDAKQKRHRGEAARQRRQGGFYWRSGLVWQSRSSLG